MAYFNRQVLNHLTRPLARHLTGFGVIIHRGRRSGRIYETPVNVFRGNEGYVIALTYGADADWVRNVRTAGVCDLITQGHRMRVAFSHIEHDELLLLVPPIVRPILHLIHVADFLHLISPQSEHETSLPYDGSSAGKGCENCSSLLALNVRFWHRATARRSAATGRSRRPAYSRSTSAERDDHGEAWDTRGRSAPPRA